MATVALRETDHRPERSRLLELDAGAVLPRGVRVAVSILVIMVFGIMIGLWLQPLRQPNRSLAGYAAPTVITVPALWTVASGCQRVAEPETGPRIAVRLLPGMAETGSYSHELRMIR